MRTLRILFGLLILLLLVAIPVVAQEDSITDDDVNSIAKKMYCPVCENIPLDTCGTAACQDWREEIRLFLEDGMSEQQIINDFVIRFGDRVVGTPQDPTLRTVNLLTPWIVVGIAFIVLIFSFVRWYGGRQQNTATNSPAPNDSPDNEYLSRLEQDIAG